MPASHDETQIAIDGFATSDKKAMSDILLAAIHDIARTGNVCYRWGTLVHLLEFQLRVVLETSSENYPIQSEDFLAGDGSYQESCNRLYLLLSTFEGPPFTVQRMCEILSTPHKHHRTKLKLLAALDKMLSVTSIIPEGFPIDSSLDEHMPNHTDSQSVDASSTRLAEQGAG
eukprot:CAMPEP_0173102170 /NCGR_PEP_ID=MMETSP1102-20130122/37378_1 /TAXON_ID=49646 /ORGANISM="Geminigera sp., Strain Caron Lab Isolate" /LENGTH=171 /DNA_ID=CAMNT_0013996229 /DNA_START=348 /DNA_END=859 /DNA_ORIENTATION=-